MVYTIGKVNGVNWWIMNRKFWWNSKLGLALTLAIIVPFTSGAAQLERKVPYWASVKEQEARMRTGPSTEFPVKWVYKRQNLPVKVLGIHSDWRKVQDPDGDQGWMHVRLLSPNRTGLVIGSGVVALRESANATARIVWRAEPGVTGRIDECTPGWCRFDNAGRTGYVESERLWGDETP
jgi:SH3-like domain-containing protein